MYDVSTMLFQFYAMQISFKKECVLSCCGFNFFLFNFPVGFDTWTRWFVILDPVLYEGPDVKYVVSASLNNKTVTIADVLFGDVWICAGQSNMRFTVNMVSPHTHFRLFSTSLQLVYAIRPSLS